MRGHSSMFLWTSPQYYFPARLLWQSKVGRYLTKFGGPCEKVDALPVEAAPAGTVKA